MAPPPLPGGCLFIHRCGTSPPLSDSGGVYRWAGGVLPRLMDMSHAASPRRLPTLLLLLLPCAHQEKFQHPPSTQHSASPQGTLGLEPVLLCTARIALYPKGVTAVAPVVVCKVWAPRLRHLP
eukprot:GGOE01002641.1.p2 GENE.GGOE01002641.1~~GGOE01002641.1.p2  ORF type:complete len:123 (-),score=1.09 GGOE01002641.1:673-1041(-)